MGQDNKTGGMAMKLLDETNKKEIIKRIEGGAFEEKLKKFLILQGNKCLSYNENGIYFYGVPEIGFMYFGLANVKIKARVNAHITYLNDHTKGKGSEAERSIRLKDCLDKVIFIPIYNGGGFLGKKERALIKMFNSFVDDNKEFGLNYTRGGEDPSEETRKKIAEAQDRIEITMIDIETKKKTEYASLNDAERETGIANGHISEALLGKRPSAGGKLFVKGHNVTQEEANRLVDEYHKRIKKSIEAWKEARIEALKGACSKQIIAKHPTTGEKLIFNSINEAERLGVGNGRKVDKSHVSACCKRNHEELNGLEIKHKNKSHVGYKWYYVDDFKKYFRKEWEEFIKNIK